MLSVLSDEPIGADIRNDFPILQRQIGNHSLVYFDSAATTLKPSAVIDKERAYSTDYTANVHRGKHQLSEEASERFEDARRTIARFLGVPAKAVIFVKNATEAINTVARGVGLSCTDKVLLSTSEHHSNILPWMREATVVWLNQHPIEPLRLQYIADSIDRERPKLIAISYASNVTGVINPIKDICQLAHDRGVLTCIDASQAISHSQIDVSDLGCDFLAFSGHKMLSPVGIGVLTGKLDQLERLEPLSIGGGCVEMVSTSGFTLRALPYRLEGGTPNISGAIGLAAAIEYLTKIGYDRIITHQRRMGDLLEKVLLTIGGCKLVMSKQYPRAAIGSLAIHSENVSPEQIAVSLSENYGIMARSGFFCAHPLIQELGHAKGLLRLSLYIYNTPEEIDYLGDGLRNILRRLVAS